jgi:group I intron endonuclease
MIVYKIENKINGDIYIGQTRNSVSGRISVHLRSNFRVGNALRKYGIQSFEISVIDSADSAKVLNEKECYWIKKYNCKNPNGYNMTDGGEGTDGPNTEEWKLKLRKPHGPMSEENKEIHRRAANRPEVLEHNRKINTGRILSEEHKQSIGRGLLGRVVTEETKQKIRMTKIGERNPMYGRRHSDETKKKIKMGNIGKHGRPTPNEDDTLPGG